MTAGRNWYQIYLLFLAAVFVGFSWISGGEGQVIASSFPAWAQGLWYGGLLVGAGLALVGIAMHTITGLLLERASLFFLSGLCASYGLAFLAASARSDVFHAAYVVFFVLSFAGVNLLRARQIRRDVDEERLKLRKLGDIKETLGKHLPPEATPS